MRLIACLAVPVLLFPLVARGAEDPGSEELGRIFIDAINAPVPFVKKRTNFKLNSFRKLECRPSVERNAGRTVCLARASVGNQPETEKFVVLYRSKAGKLAGTLEASFAEGDQLQAMSRRHKGK